jgi:hypothetical protein
MRRFTLAMLLAGLVMGGGRASAQEAEQKLAAQRKAASDNWALLEAGEAASHETEHLLLMAPKSMERRLKEIGTSLEKSHALAGKAAQIKPKEGLWPGKLTVYLIPERQHFTAFVRRVETRRLNDDESGTYAVLSDLPHVSASAPRTRSDLGLELQAAAQIAAALMQKKAGAKVPLPEWLVAGFGRATVWRAVPADKLVVNDRRLARAAVVGKKRMPVEVWGESTLEGEEAGVVRASLAEFLAYGPGASKFAALLEGFKPGENMDSRTMEQALESAKLDPKAIEARWGPWVAGGSK